MGSFDRPVEHGDRLRLELTYALAALDRVREMAAREQDCCAFLIFDLQQEVDAVRLVIKAPEDARDALDAALEPFHAHEPAVRGARHQASITGFARCLRGAGAQGALKRRSRKRPGQGDAAP
jgi:hypothetical protein